MKTIRPRLEPWLDLGDLLGAFHLADAGMGPEGDLHVLVNEERRYAALLDCASQVRRIEVGALDLTSPSLQPLPHGELLIVDRVSDGEPNAFVFDESGDLQREFFLGDGIECVQTAASGRIWASFFDEGIYGKGAPEGLICCDASGRRLYSYDYKDAGTGPIDDCHALNVASDSETWIYFYSDFPVVRIRDTGASRMEYSVWMGLQNSGHAIAVLDHQVLVGADSIFEHYQLGDSEPLALIRFADETGEPLRPTKTMGRGSQLFFLVGNRCYRFGLPSGSAPHPLSTP